MKKSSFFLMDDFFAWSPQTDYYYSKAMQSEILIVLQSEAEIVMGKSVEAVRFDVTTQN